MIEPGLQTFSYIAVQACFVLRIMRMGINIDEKTWKDIFVTSIVCRV